LVIAAVVAISIRHDTVVYQPISRRLRVDAIPNEATNPHPWTPTCRGTLTQKVNLVHVALGESPRRAPDAVDPFRQSAQFARILVLMFFDMSAVHCEKRGQKAEVEFKMRACDAVWPLAPSSTVECTWSHVPAQFSSDEPHERSDIDPRQISHYQINRCMRHSFVASPDQTSVCKAECHDERF
jgi:hypothetical protein